MGVALDFAWCLLISYIQIQHSLSAPDQHLNTLEGKGLAENDGFMSGEPSSLPSSSSVRGSGASAGRSRDPVTGDEYGAMYGGSPGGHPGTPGGLTGIGGTLWCGVRKHRCRRVTARRVHRARRLLPSARPLRVHHSSLGPRRYGLINMGAETMSHCACDAECALSID